MRQNRIIGAISATALSLIVATLIGPSSMHIVYADANCDEADESVNSAGNNKGNSKQCGNFEAEGPKEPVRSCETPNAFKNNDGDSSSTCKNRGK